MDTFLFDFDGTLVDSMPIYVKSMLKILDENGVKYGDDIVKIITPLGLDGSAEYFIKLGVKMSKEALIYKMGEHMYEEYCNNIPAKEYVFETLSELKKCGCKLNVLTASPHITLDPCLKRLGLYDLFENVWSCDDFNTTKADVEIYKMAAEKMGEKVENILFLDDNLNADLTAKKAGMRVCAVFDESSAEYEQEMRKETDFYIRDFSQLLALYKSGFAKQK